MLLLESSDLMRLRAGGASTDERSEEVVEEKEWEWEGEDKEEEVEEEVEEEEDKEAKGAN